MTTPRPLTAPPEPPADEEERAPSASDRPSSPGPTSGATTPREADGSDDPFATFAGWAGEADARAYGGL